MRFQLSSMCVVFVAMVSYVSSVQATCLTSCSIYPATADCTQADLDPNWNWPSTEYLGVYVDCGTACCAPPMEGQEPGDNCDFQELSAAETIEYVELNGDMRVTDTDYNGMLGTFATTDTLCDDQPYFLYDKMLSPGSYLITFDNVANAAYVDVFDSGDDAVAGSSDSGCALAGNGAPMAPTALWLLLSLAGVFWVQRRRLN